MADVSRSRGWCLTLNNPTEYDHCFVYDLINCIEEYHETEKNKPAYDYFVVGNEVGKSGTPHFQMFIYFGCLKSFKQLKEMFPSAHIERMRGEAYQAATYCKKDGDFLQAGVCPLSHDQKVQKGGQAWLDMYRASIELIKEGDYKSLPLSVTNHIKAIEYRAMREIEQERNLTPLDGDFQNVWIWGRAGVGKSVLARQMAPGVFPKTPNKWWDFYKTEEDVLIDDFDIRHQDQILDLKRWTDRWMFVGEYKGSSTKLRPRRFIITSNYHPRAIWSRWEDLDPILRRFKIIELKKRPDGSVDQVVDPPYEVPIE